MTAPRSRGLARVAVATLSMLFVPLPIPARAAPLDPATIAGVYKSRFQNGDVNGRTFTSEDILEIVPLSPTTAYVKTHLEFYNGHQCAIAGVADVVDDALVYVDRSDDATVVPNRRCVLKLRASPTKIVFDDADSACKALYCGVRGGFVGGFDRTARRTIRYMKLLKASEDFRRAIAEHDGGKPVAPTTR